MIMIMKLKAVVMRVVIVKGVLVKVRARPKTLRANHKQEQLRAEKFLKSWTFRLINNYVKMDFPSQY